MSRLNKGDPAYVLVVEDDVEVREAISATLEECAHHAVTRAPDGRAALEHLRRRPNACVIVLDLMMPQMNGFALVEALRLDERLRAIPLVVFTAMPDPFGADLGAFAVLRKPTSARALSETVGRLCSCAPGWSDGSMPSGRA